MSEMFTKCNGFIVSGDPLVYADSATMTGQGTVSEPFGVKSTDLFVQEPLYTGTSGNSAYIGWRPDETVLYSGDRTSAASLSENPANFNKMRVIDIYHNVYEFKPSTAGDVHQEIKMTNFTGQPQMLFVQFSGTQTKYYITKGFQEVFNTWDTPNTTLTAANLNGTYSREIITEVIGINRKV